ncbi:pentapeptide repeat-containing protein [Roseovarius salinarum]|uniref:pentapeptide repeat-containing protein n=1 Tax=Roseovarius salinarum TaxID=1981892 RepID=UPI000C325FE7|nr:pentapeptide repeat-containing protein [Roseovarius salinarum]
MSRDDRPDILDWLGLRQRPVWAAARWLGPLLSVTVIALFLLAVATAFVMLGGAIFGSTLDSPRATLGTGAVTVALIGAPFVVWRAIVAQKQADVAEQGHITERINTAVQGLGAEKEVKRDGVESTEPNLEVRIGAIYALERIARDSDRDHVQIMEILCAYIRQNAPAPQADDWPELEMREGEDDGPLAADWNERLQAFREAQAKAKAGLKPREDIQVALTVIGRRTAKQRRLEAGRGEEVEFPFDREPPEYDGPEDGHDKTTLATHRARVRAWKEALIDYTGYRLDLRNADLRGADLSGLNLNGARLDGTFLQGADLWQARLQGAELMAARLQGADLREIRLQWAQLAEARLQGAHLWGARLQGADLEDARLQEAKLLHVSLQGAYLGWARLQGADLGSARFGPDTDLSWANLSGAAARSVDFTGMPEIADQLAGMFGDGSVKLPDGCDRPAHWPRQELDFGEFLKQWREWQADPNGYTPPERTAG